MVWREPSAHTKALLSAASLIVPRRSALQRFFRARDGAIRSAMPVLTEIYDVLR